MPAFCYGFVLVLRGVNVNFYVRVKLSVNLCISFLFLLIAYFHCDMMFVCTHSEIHLSLVPPLKDACGHLRHKLLNLRHKIKGILIMKVECVFSCANQSNEKNSLPYGMFLFSLKTEQELGKKTKRLTTYSACLPERCNI